MDELRHRLTALLPEGPFLYPEDDVSTQHLRFFASELIRETTLEQLDDEVPHAIACAVEEFREDRSPVYIRAVIYVERDSQKRIVIGHEGRAYQGDRPRGTSEDRGPGVVARLPRPVGESAAELATGSRRAQATWLRNSGGSTVMTLSETAPRDVGLPEVQGRTRVPAGGIAIRLPHVSSQLSRPRRHTHHAD